MGRLCLPRGEIATVRVMKADIYRASEIRSGSFVNFHQHEAGAAVHAADLYCVGARREDHEDGRVVGRGWKRERSYARECVRQGGNAASAKARSPTDAVREVAASLASHALNPQTALKEA